MFYLGFNICLAILFIVYDKQTMIYIVNAKINFRLVFTLMVTN